jgi:hypothetical protein
LKTGIRIESIVGRSVVWSGRRKAGTPARR